MTGDGPVRTVSDAETAEEGSRPSRVAERWRLTVQADLQHWIALALIVGIGLAVRVIYLTQPIRYDEAFTYLRYSDQPIVTTMSIYNAPNNHILHSLLANVSLELFGGSVWALRLPAFAAGVLLIPATYALGRLLYGKDAALIAAGLVAASSILIEYSANARGYTLLALAFLVVVALADSLRRRPGRWRWLALAVVTALGFYTIPIMAFPFTTVVLWLTASAVAGDTRMSVRAIVARLFGVCAVTGVLTLLLYAPVIARNGAGYLLGNRFVAPDAVEVFAYTFPIMLRGTWALWTRDIPVILLAVLVGGFVLACVRHKRVGSHVVPFPLLALLVAFACAVAMRVEPFPRLWLYLLPVVFLGAAAGLVGLLRDPSRSMRAVSLLTVVLTATLAAAVVNSRSVLESTETGVLPDAEEIALYLSSEYGLRPGDRVLAEIPSDEPLAFHLKRYGVPRSYLTAAPQPGGRIIVVVNEVERHTLKFVLEEVPVGPRLPVDTALATARALRRFPSATLWEVPLSTQPGQDLRATDEG